MIEVLFGESEAGSMKCAKSDRINRTFCDGPTAVFGDASRLPPTPETWESVPGNAGEVICLDYMLDVGDIRESFDSEYRKNLLFSFYTQGGWEDQEKFFDRIKEEIALKRKEYERLMHFLEKGEEIRIWYSHAPYALCGLYWVCSLLRNVENKIYIVELPEHEEKENNTIVQYRNWGEIPPEQFSRYLPRQRALSVNERRMYGSMWAELREDNRPLRAFVNGELIGVPEDFYDFLIRKLLTKEPVKEARLIGDILGKYPVNTGDWWYAARIDRMIETGEIKIVEDCREKYRRTICLGETIDRN